MRYSAAFRDYQERIRKLIPLLRLALESDKKPELATAAAKGAVVLAAAAAERFMNDALRQACQQLQVDSYGKLSDSQQAYLCTQIARTVASFDSEDIRKFSASRRDKLKSAIDRCAEAFRNPSKWSHMPDYGMFLDGAAEPARINAVLRDFDPDRGDFLTVFDGRRAGKEAFVRALSELIDARHNAAHAKPATDPSPTDARSWIVTSFWFIRAVEAQLFLSSK